MFTLEKQNSKIKFLRQPKTEEKKKKKKKNKDGYKNKQEMSNSWANVGRHSRRGSFDTLD